MNSMRVVSLALTFTILLSTVLGGCSKGATPANTENPKAPGSSAEKSEETKQELTEVSIAIWGAEDSLADPDDPILKTIEEKTGVKLVPQNITWDDGEQKVLLWATNGQLPDIFAGDFVSRSFYGNWIKEEVIRALPEDLSSYPNLEKQLSIERSQAAKRDGRYYMIPRTTYGDITYSVLDRNVAYRWDLAQQAGVTKEPETYEEFADMIKKIIAADPESKSISGMTAILPGMLTGFVYPYGGILEKKWVHKDNQFILSYFADRSSLVDSMQLARDFYTEGVIEKDIALAKLETSKEKFLQGQSAALTFAWGGPAGLYHNISRDYEELYPDRDFLEDVRFTKLYPGKDGKKYYFVDTEAWSESYISSNVDDEKLQAICKLFDFLYSEEGQRLTFCGIEGEDYDIMDGKVVMKEGIVLNEKYAFKNGSVSELATWEPSWDMNFPSTIPDAYRQLNVARHQDAVKNGTLPEYYDNVLFLSTPLKDSFTFNPSDDLLQVMMGNDPVDKMVDDLLASYETKGLSKMIDEVNAAAKEAGITKK